MIVFPPGSEPRRLPEYWEARGWLVSVSGRDAVCIAVFNFGSVALPPELGSKLCGLVGKEVACLRLSGVYHVREVS